VIRCISRSIDEASDLGVGNCVLSALILIRLLSFFLSNLILGYVGSKHDLVPISFISFSFETFFMRLITSYLAGILRASDDKEF